MKKSRLMVVIPDSMDELQADLELMVGVRRLPKGWGEQFK